MKVALVQLNAKDNLWSTGGLSSVLQQISDVDLIVFPECMPFDEPTPISIAEQQLAEISGKHSDIAFIAGGYVIEEGIQRNAVFLCQKGKVLNHYFKRLPWQEPAIAPGGETKLFTWDNGSCIPLICADAVSNPSPTGTRMMHEALMKGAGPKVPIIVSSYGTWLFEDYWHTPLKTWAAGCDTPVLVAAVSGKGDYFEESDTSGNYGGGGSGLFRPHHEPVQRKERGIYIFDTDNSYTKSINIKTKP